MMEESSVITYDDEIDVDEESGRTGGGLQKCEFNEVAMSPSLEYFVQVSYAITQYENITVSVDQGFQRPQFETPEAIWSTWSTRVVQKD